jgi:hypothetical protein
LEVENWKLGGVGGSKKEAEENFEVENRKLRRIGR